MIDIQRIPPAQLRRYRGLTFPAYRPLLESDGARSEHTLAVAATVLDRRLGLALARTPSAKGEPGRLLSLFVDAKMRNQGIGGQLVARLEEELLEMSCPWLYTSYLDNSSSIASFERVLKRREWSEPQPRSYSLRFTRDQARQVPWFQKYKLRPRYELFPWTELTQVEREELIRSQEESPWIDEDLVPWKYDEGFEPVTSTGLRADGKVAGWVINHQISADTMRITCAFVRKDLQRSGKMLPVFSESLDLMQKTSMVNVVCVTRLHHPGMLQFFRRWCLPWANSLVESKQSEKTLIPGARGRS